MREPALPPGPPLPPCVQAGLILRHWPRFVTACRRRHGSVFTLHVASLGTLVYLDDPADIKTVFAGTSPSCRIAAHTPTCPATTASGRT